MKLAKIKIKMNSLFHEVSQINEKNWIHHAQYIPLVEYSLKNVGPNENCIFLGQTQQNNPKFKEQPTKGKMETDFGQLKRQNNFEDDDKTQKAPYKWNQGEHQNLHIWRSNNFIAVVD